MTQAEDAGRWSIASIDESGQRSWPGWRVLAAVLVSYFAFVAVATYPVIFSFTREIAGQPTDPLEHLWIMRWSEVCLKQGRSPFFCPSLNYPTGVPLGLFPTMHVQTAAYLVMGLFTSSDVLRFNLLWLSGFLATGLGTFLLAWWVIRQVWPAWLAGLGMMLSGPMMMHAHGHLETMQMGAVPLFLMAWLRFVDRPGRRRLAVSVGLYLVMVACAPYFAVLAIFPALLAVGFSFGQAERGQRWAWLVGHMGWLVGFGIMALAGLAVLFSSQIWAVAHGYSLARPRYEFDTLGAPLWSMFLPSPLHKLGGSAMADLYRATGSIRKMSECSSYLGVVTLVLLGYAAALRIKFPRRAFWWSALVLMVVLSWGSRIEIRTTKIPLPAGWIYGIFPPFHLIRVPARFNLFACACAAVPASAALGELLRRISCSRRRVTSVIVLALIMLADLAIVPFNKTFLPPMPPAYRDLTSKNPNTTLVDAPMFGWNEDGKVFLSLWGYWQSIHGAKTTAGYPGMANVAFEAEIVQPSPFRAGRLLEKKFLADTHSERFGPVEGVDARDYAWLYLTTYRFEHLVWHQGIFFDRRYAAGGARVRALLDAAKVFEDADVVIFDRDRMRPPEHLIWLCAEGFRPAFVQSVAWSFGVLRQARIVVFIPEQDPGVIVRLTNVSAFAHRREVRLVEGETELAKWNIEPDDSRAIQTPLLHLSSGLHELRLLSDSDDRPTRSIDRVDDAGTTYSLRLNSVQVFHPAPVSR